MSIAGACATVIALGAFSPAAYAGDDVILSPGQGLSATNAKANPNVHLNGSTSGVSDHKWCPAHSDGYGGYTSTPFTGGSNTYYDTCQPGGNHLSWSWGSYEHGAAYNITTTQFDTFTGGADLFF